ncbi:MAG: efflux transporter outer membrane subunit, partial [Pseudomonadota bacterium]
MPDMKNRSKNWRTLLTVAASTAALAACAAIPNLGPGPELAAPSHLASARSFAAAETTWPSDRWWESFGDTQLNTLIDEALADSPTLAVAAARLRQARAAAEQAGSARYPNIAGQASGNAVHQDLSGDNLPAAINSALPDDWTTQSNTALRLDYAIDFFGRNRAQFAAALSQSKAAAAEAAEARLELSTAVALTYAEFVRLAADRQAAEDAVQVREASARLVARRVANGLESQAPAHQAQSELERARAELIAVDAAIARTRNELAALLGKGPDRGLEVIAPQAPHALATGLPPQVGLDLIGRRPDLVAARLNAEAAAQRINVARADFYPNINLSAVVSFQTLGIDAIGGGNLSAASIGPALSLPIFSGGRLQGAYRGARAEYDASVALYDQTLANALRDVANAFSGRRAIEQQLQQQRAALHDAEEAYRLVRLRYQGG